MRQLVQDHLSGDDCVALLGTCHQVAKTTVQHRTHNGRQALWWSGWVPSNTLEDATTTRLMLERAPAELKVTLCGEPAAAERSDLGDESHDESEGSEAPRLFSPTLELSSLPVALLPLISSLELTWLHLAPQSMEVLQRCRRLHTLDVDRCSFEDADMGCLEKLWAKESSSDGYIALMAAHLDKSVRLARQLVREQPLRTLPQLRELK